MANVVVTTIFVWLSNRVEQATTVMTTWICGSGKGSEPPSLPSHNVDANDAGAYGNGGGSPNMRVEQKVLWETLHLGVSGGYRGPWPSLQSWIRSLTPLKTGGSLISWFRK